ncbi:anthranilate synthase component I family protein [Daejeonella sp.]|jgi:para-aminobenzoate synthetase component 1|uniref:anthranilate synthase component I family protein n=1 Tax=Daejeonella sp. TaxID=2805397 RepID=UPI0037BEF10A
MLKVFTTDNLETFKLKGLYWANSFSTACYFDSNQYTDPYSAFDVFIAAGVKKELNTSEKGSFDQLKDFLTENHDFIPGYFAYDLKNHAEELYSHNPDHLGFQDIFFFLPQHSIQIKGNQVQIITDSPDNLWKILNEYEIPKSGNLSVKPKIQSRFSRDEYISTVKEIQKHIQRGDIYELNFCQEFYAENYCINPLEVFIQLNTISPTPFANYFKINNHFIISATPERFLSRRGNKLISQPIKGTSSRKSDAIQDEEQKKMLLKNEKERSENVMIVDLVRNDLTKSAKAGSVKVEELFGLYSFKQVHQMISTVVCQVKEDLPNTTIISNTFPMGSMTGAPKISAMQLAEKYERSKRGVYSGALGYFAPNGDFDFNVVIRTILYNADSNYLSFHAGSAITLDSEPEKEYDECLLKGMAILEVLSLNTP